MFKIRAALNLALLAASIHAPPAFGDSLDDLVRSGQMSEFDDHSAKLKRKVRHKENWMDPDSEYAGIFASNRAPQRIFDWCAPSVNGYSRFPVESRKEIEFVRAWARFESRDSRNEIVMTVVVPHPRYISAVDLGLIKSVAKMKDPLPDATENRKLTVRERPALLSHIKGKSCKLIIDQIKESFILLEMAECRDPDQLINFGRSLDLGRLNRKLNS